MVSCLAANSLASCEERAHLYRFIWALQRAEATELEFMSTVRLMLPTFAPYTKQKQGVQSDSPAVALWF